MIPVTLILWSFALLKYNTNTPGRREKYNHNRTGASPRRPPESECFCLCATAFSGPHLWDKRYLWPEGHASSPAFPLALPDWLYLWMLMGASAHLDSWSICFRHLYCDSFEEGFPCYPKTYDFWYVQGFLRCVEWSSKGFYLISWYPLYCYSNNKGNHGCWSRLPLK